MSDTPHAMTFKRISRGLFQDGAGRYWARVTIDGKRTKRRLWGLTQAQAEAELKSGEFAQSRTAFSQLAKEWLALGCPVSKTPRSPVYLPYATRLLHWPLARFGSLDCREITTILVDDYPEWRMGLTRKAGCTGSRAADMEMTCCAQLYRWAERRMIVTSNPFLKREHQRNEVRHCSERAPVSGDIVHQTASYLLKDVRSESSAFAFLFLCLTGLRKQEALSLQLRRPPSNEPGACDGEFLAVARSKKSRPEDASCTIRLWPEAKSLYQAWQHWHAERFPFSPFWFPGRKGLPLCPSALWQALSRASKALSLPHIAPHGCRSFYTSVLRARISDDRLVADYLGHKNPQMVQQIYGGRPVHCQAHSVLPSQGEPAWACWLPGEKIVAMA